MITYKVYYRYKGKIDNMFIQAENELGAKAELIRRSPKAKATNVVIYHMPEEPMAEVIYVDFKARKRVA